MPVRTVALQDYQTSDHHHGLPLPRLPEDDRQRVFVERRRADRRLTVTSGEPVIGGKQEMEGLQHYFCGFCMSWVFTRFPAIMGDFVNLRSTMLDDPAGTEPFLETCTAEALAWARTPAERSYEGFPPMEEFPSLLQAYAAR